MLKAIFSIVAIAFLATMAIPAYASHNAFDELDVYTNGTHYIFNKYIDDHLYGNSIVNYDGNQIVQTGTLRIDETNANKWYLLPTLDPGRYHWDWYMDTARTQDIDSITFTVNEPTPVPTPEPTPEPTKSDVCHNGNTINVSSNALDAHLKHGDTQGECIIESTPKPVIPTNSTESNSKCGPGTIFDAEYNACILDKPESIPATNSTTTNSTTAIPETPIPATPTSTYIPTQSSNGILVCYDGNTIRENGSDLRQFISLGATVGECEISESTPEPTEYSQFIESELVDKITELIDELAELLEELKSR